MLLQDELEFSTNREAPQRIHQNFGQPIFNFKVTDIEGKKAKIRKASVMFSDEPSTIKSAISKAIERKSKDIKRVSELSDISRQRSILVYGGDTALKLKTINFENTDDFNKSMVSTPHRN